MDVIRSLDDLQARLLQEIKQAEAELKRLPKDVHSWGTGDIQDNSWWKGKKHLAEQLLMSIDIEP